MYSPALPQHIGILLFTDFEALDAFGPLNCLNALSRSFQLRISIITHSGPSGKPAHTWPTTPGPQNSHFTQGVVPTHSFANSPEDLDLLLVPGGYGVWEETEEMQAAKDFIRNVYPNLKYMCTICTGSALVAMTGLLDNRKATSNKRRFKAIVGKFPRVNWVGAARWVVDGNIYTASGVTAGIDMTLAFIQDVYGKEHADEIADRLEYERVLDSRLDVFAAKNGVV